MCREVWGFESLRGHQTKKVGCASNRPFAFGEHAQSACALCGKNEKALPCSAGRVIRYPPAS
jgi:hypothetical protein